MNHDQYARTGRSDCAQDLIEMRDELAELERLASQKDIQRQVRSETYSRPFFNARYYLEHELRRTAARLIGEGCPGRWDHI